MSDRREDVFAAYTAAYKQANPTYKAPSFLDLGGGWFRLRTFHHSGSPLDSRVRLAGIERMTAVLRGRVAGRREGVGERSE